jgi:hypothetical protein
MYKQYECVDKRNWYLELIEFFILYPKLVLVLSDFFFLNGTNLLCAIQYKAAVESYMNETTP